MRNRTFRKLLAKLKRLAFTQTTKVEDYLCQECSIENLEDFAESVESGKTIKSNLSGKLSTTEGPEKRKGVNNPSDIADDNLLNTQGSKIIFPRAFAVAIDDLGWNIGNNAGDIDGQGPYRIGLNRKMDLDDYRAVVEVGEAVGVRMQGLFVLSEMDRSNILKEYPSTTWQGKDWDNSANICQTQIDIMEYVKNSAAFLEFGLHGVGHEYWADGVRKRAEWYCTDDKQPWDKKNMRIHIQCFKDIMAQYGLSEENGHSFPESFVPCACGYYWNPTDKYSTGNIMSDSGVKYVNTDFNVIKELNPPKGDNGGGFDNGVVVVNRKNYGNDWYKLSKLPTVPLKDQISDIIESHWINWLAQDKFLQKETTRKWIDYYKNVQASSDRYIAKNTEQFYAQWLYKKYTTVNELKVGQVEIDNSKMPKEYYENNILGSMVLKVKLKDGEHISQATINNKPIACYFEDAGYGFMYLPVLQPEKYKLDYKISKNMLPFTVFNDGTYNVYNIIDNKDIKIIKLRVYGTQDIKVICNKPVKNIKSDNPNIKIISENYNEKNNILSIILSAKDIQGESGSIKLYFKEELN